MTAARTYLVPWAAAAAVFLAGCGGGSGQSEYEQMKQAEQSVNDALTSQGAKLKAMTYPIGTAWSVNLSGVTITDDLLRKVKQLGKVSELDLSRTNVTDAQLGLIQELGLAVLLNKFDLSNTAVTDAGFNKLDNMRFLSQMNLAGTKVTPAAVAEFKKKRLSDTRVKQMFRNPTIRTS